MQYGRAAIALSEWQVNAAYRVTAILGDGLAGGPYRVFKFPEVAGELMLLQAAKASWPIALTVSSGLMASV